MTTTQAPVKEATTTAPIIGTVRSPITLIRRLPHRVARVSFRLEHSDEHGTRQFNCHADGAIAELIRATVHHGDHLTVHPRIVYTSHPLQTILDAEVATFELDLR